MNNTFINSLKEETTETETLNGSKTYSTSLSANLDLFFLGSALRGQEKDKILDLFTKAFAENKELAIANLWYLRDVRGGQRERQQARNIINYLGKNYNGIITKDFLKKIVNYGRYDDLWILLKTNKELIIEFIKECLDNNNSLIAKWLPSENTSSEETRYIAKIIRSGLKMSSKDYRQLLSKLRKQQNIVETKLTNKDYDKIDYEHVPSKAMLKYRKAFLEKDKERYNKFMNDVSNSVKKVNTATLTPVDIVDKYIFVNDCRPADDKVLEMLWKNLPDMFEGKKENSLVIADVSGSMFGGYNNTSTLPISVSISLAMYIAERNNGIFKNTFMTFSSRPKLQEIKGDDLFTRIQNLSQTEWGCSTDLDAVFDKILNACLKNNVPAKECPKRIYIISDMEFNYCCNSDKTTFERIKRKYADANYKIPEIFFWNINTKTKNCPVRFNEKGVALISGFSPNILKYILGKDNITPEKIMMDVLKKYME